MATTMPQSFYCNTLIVKKLHKQKMRGEQFSTQAKGYSTLDYIFCVASLITVWFKPKR